MNIELKKEYIMNKKTKKYASTYERMISEDLSFETDLNKRYKDFLLSEIILAIMEENHISIRKLAQEAGVSPSLVQDLKSGKRDNLTLKSFSSLIDVLGYDIVLEKRKDRVKKPVLHRFRIRGQKRRFEPKNEPLYGCVGL